MQTLVNQMVSFFFVSNVCHEVRREHVDRRRGLFVLPAHGRVSEPPSHGRGGGSGYPPPPPRTRKLRKIAIRGKRRSIGRGKFYKKILRSFFF